MKNDDGAPRKYMSNFSYTIMDEQILPKATLNGTLDVATTDETTTEKNAMRMNNFDDVLADPPAS